MQANVSPPGTVCDPGAELLEAPLAAQRPHTLEAHGDMRQDEYYWLRDDDRKDPAVIAHLEVGPPCCSAGASSCLPAA